MMKLLVVEDEQNIRDMLVECLQAEGFQVVSASTFAEAQQMFFAESPDIVLLDWRLPDGQGIELLKQWRHKDFQTPILFLTARVDLIDKVLGLELGANDYITKPFELRELIARVRVQERLLLQQRGKPQEDTSTILRSNEVELHLNSHEVFYQGNLLTVTRKEFALLELFLSNPGQVFTRDELLDRVWGYDQYPETRTIDTHIMQLRQKLTADLIQTVRGIGYRWIQT